MAKKSSGPASRGFGGLADAFVKAGVVDEKVAKKVENAGRRERKELGAEGIAEREAERVQRLEQRRVQDAEEAREIERRRADTALVERMHRLLREHREAGGGNRRWFFVARDGRVPFVDVSDGVMRKLGDGDAGIVESLGAVPGEHAVVTDVQTLAALAEFDPGVVRFWNRAERS